MVLSLNSKFPNILIATNSIFLSRMESLAIVSYFWTDGPRSHLEFRPAFSRVVATSFYSRSIMNDRLRSIALVSYFEDVAFSLSLSRLELFSRFVSPIPIFSVDRFESPFLVFSWFVTAIYSRSIRIAKGSIIFIRHGAPFPAW